MRYKYLLIIVISILVFFYINQQVKIVMLQYRIKELYDQIVILQQENKRILYEKIEKELKSCQRLEKYAKELKFVPPKEKDVIIEYY